MRIVLGIGNPGSRYEGTRHNLGFDVAREFAELHGVALDCRRFRSLTGTFQLGSQVVTVLLPYVYVNNIGMAAKAALDHHGVAPQSLLVIADDVNLMPGKIRVRRRGSSGGHNGLKSVSAWCHTENFPRLKLGIGQPSSTNLVTHVLSPCTPEEQGPMKAAVTRGAEAVNDWVVHGIEHSMNTFN